MNVNIIKEKIPLFVEMQNMDSNRSQSSRKGGGNIGWSNQERLHGN